MRNSVISTIVEAAGRDKNVFIICGDAGYGVLDVYQKRFPKRFLNLGIAEQNMISFAAGLSVVRYKVFVYNIVPFVLYRCYEQVRNDICYQELPVTLIGIGSGVTYAPQGVTHYSVEDIALARTLPNLVILSPCDSTEAILCARYALKSKNPVYIRIAKSGEPAIHECKISNIEEPHVIREGKDVAIVFHGSIGIEVKEAFSMFTSSVAPRLISMPMLHPVHRSALKKCLRGIHTIVSAEEHYVEGGLGTILGEFLREEGMSQRLIKLGIRNEFIHTIKNNAGMRDYYGISAKKIAAVTRRAF